MTDKDKYVDETLKKQIQESFGATDKQLKARMDRIEKTLTDDEFAGAEERMMAKFMARLAAEEKKEEPKVEETKVETVTAIVAEAVPEVKDDSEVKERNTDKITSETDAEVTDEISATVAADKKVVRFSRKKVLLVAALAAAIAGALAVTTTGKKSYFFKEYNDETVVIFNSGKNIADVSSLEEAYEEIQELFGGDVFALYHLPENTEFVSLTFDGAKAKIELKQDGNYLYFLQWKSDVESSVNTNSDRDKKNSIYNSWLNMNIIYRENLLGDGTSEFEAQIECRGIVSYLFGKIDREEFEELLKTLYFY